MENQHHFEVIIIGGSYAGLSAAMTLGRAIRKTLVIDSGKPCNRQTPYSHNFITQDGEPPLRIAEKARQQVLAYDTITFHKGLVTGVEKTAQGFKLELEDGSHFTGRKILFATGVKDIMPPIKGFADCWGISVLHCPYCHGYEVRGAKTGIIAQGEQAVEFCQLIRHWTPSLSLFTNGKAEFTEEQHQRISRLNISIVEQKIAELKHNHGRIQGILCEDGSYYSLEAIYARVPFEQHCKIPLALGCQLGEHGHLEVDFFGKTSIAGVFAAGDNTTMMRSVAAAVAAGNKAGAFINMELIQEALQPVNL